MCTQVIHMKDHDKFNLGQIVGVMLGLADATQKTQTGEFLGQPLVANPGETVQEVIKRWEDSWPPIPEAA